VPESGTDWLAPRLKELSVTASVPFTVLPAAGVKVTETVQLDPPCSWPGQLLVSANPPPVEMPLMFSGLPPRLEMVSVCGALVYPTFCEKSRAGGLKAMAEGRGAGNGTGVTPKT
jgi:hypothetical protein